MIESKAWQWEKVETNTDEWNNPIPEMYYLSDYWENKKFKTFLDIGCGCGRNAIFMARKNFDVCGFDLSECAVNQTVEKAKLEGVKLNNIVVADMINFPYADESFDCALAYQVISHTDKEGFKKILKEIYRVLKTDGEILLTVGSKESASFTSKKNIPLDDCTVIKVEDGPENGIPHFYISDEDCGELFNDFKILEIKNVRKIKSNGKVSALYQVWLKK